MSRVANQPVSLPKGVELKKSAAALSVKGPKGELSMADEPLVRLKAYPLAGLLSSSSPEPVQLQLPD